MFDCSVLKTYREIKLLFPPEEPLPRQKKFPVFQCQKRLNCIDAECYRSASGNLRPPSRSLCPTLPQNTYRVPLGLAITTPVPKSLRSCYVQFAKKEQKGGKLRA